MAQFIKGVAVEGFPFELVNKTTGAGITSGTVGAWITQDGGIQIALTGTSVHEGNGQWTINLSAGEMNADMIGLLFTHADGVPQGYRISTTEPLAVAIAATPVSGPSIADTFNYYGTIERASNYFLKRLNTGPWDDAIASDREAALIMATQQIDTLNFMGDVAIEGQVLQFPRNDDNEIPNAINQASYEIALKLLDGYEPEQEAESIGVLTDAYSGVRSTYDSTHVQAHIRAGIASIRAWELLKPFLRDPAELRLSRVS